MDTSGNKTADFDLIRQIQSDIKSDANFFLFLFALFIFVVWIIFISFFFSRLLGLFVGYWFRRFLQWCGVSNIVELSIGSFSISILSGKIMFREVLLLTDDYTLRINDGWIIFSYWKYVSKNVTVQECMNVSRLHLLFNGLKFQIFNRLSMYQNIAKQIGLSQFFKNLNTTMKDISTTNNKPKTNSELLEMQLDAWWDKIWKLFGAVRFDISSGRFIVGNHLLPAACAVTFENLQSRIFLTDASNKDEDRYMFRLRASVENVRVALVKATDFVENDVSNIKQEDPPRTMGDGFAILQSAMIQFYYHQDLLGLVKDDQQLPNVKVPVWETIWRLDKNTVISYGPWADKQRAIIYSFFFPSDYGCMSVTEMPKKGERRILINHDVRVSLLHDSSIDFWFMRNEELNAIHSRVKQGSSFEFFIPFITTETGFLSEVRGSLLCFESTTSLPFREFISCETFRFNVKMRYPRAFNHHQNWDLSFELHHFSSFLLWDHKRFIMDVISEWNADMKTDLCNFVPLTYNFDIKVVDKFEIVFLLNDKNWVDTSSSQESENLQAAIVGMQLFINFSLIFTEFEPDTTPFELKLNAEKNIAVRVYVSPQCTLAPVFTALKKCSNYNLTIKPSNVQVNVAHGENWVELWRTESIEIKCEYEFYSISQKCKSEIPLNFLQKWIKYNLKANPWDLNPDNLFFEVNIGTSEILFSGLLIKMILNFKDNYFSNYDQISDVSTKSLHIINNKETVDELNAENYRSMNLYLKLKINEIKAHCLTHNNLSLDENVSNSCFSLNSNQLLVELKKANNDCLIQIFTNQILISYDLNKHLNTFLLIDELQFRGEGLYSNFEVPWSVEALEYAWLVEVILGKISGTISMKNLVSTLQFLDSFLVLLLFVDEEMEMPEKFNICQHFENIRFCSKSDLKIIDNRNRWQKCETIEALKYKMIRVAIDLININLLENQHLLKLSNENCRFSYCNAHAGSFGENILLQFDYLHLNQFVQLQNTSENWLCCGTFELNKFESSIKLPYKHSEQHLHEQRKIFLNKHDSFSRNRLYFLSKNQFTNSCSCFGASNFFGEIDESGKAFFEKNSVKLAVSNIQINSNSQLPFKQSILNQGQSTIKPDPKHSVASNLLIDLNTNYKENVARKISDASFHSATSQNNLNNSTNILDLNDYAIFLEEYKIDLLKCSDKKISNGISKLKLFNKKNLIENENGKTKKENDMSNETDINSDVDFFTFELKVNFNQNIEIFFSVIALEGIEQFVASFFFSVQTFHPAYLAQQSYRKCSMIHHNQPLTSSIVFRKKENSFAPEKTKICINIPSINLRFLQCKSSSITVKKNYINSIALLQTQPFKINICSSHKSQLYELHQLDYNWSNINTHFEILQIIEEKFFDTVFNKTPVTAQTNWNKISAYSEKLQNYCLKVILDVHLPEIKSYGTIEKLFILNFDDQEFLTKKNQCGDKLFIEISKINVISVLGKSIEDPPLKENNKLNYVSELSFFEVLGPILGTWKFGIIKCAKTIKKFVNKAQKWNDMLFTKLLADSLEWHDDRSIIQLEKLNCMQDVKLYQKNFNSCPSCKLVHNLLHYVAHNNKKIENEYIIKVCKNSSIFKSKSLRKSTIIALLSHWQTLICRSIQLADNNLAHKYKYNTSTISKEKCINETSIKSLQKSSKTDLKKQDKANVNNTLTVNPNSLPNQNKDCLSLLSFHPTHRRGASNATQITVSGVESEPQDLYHWILKAHKDYKERRNQNSAKKLTEIPVTEVNSMELLLFVFFWTIYNDLELEESLLDFMPKKNKLDFDLKISEVKLGIVEKKFLLSMQNEVLVALSSNPLLTVENVEINGKLNIDTKLDEYLLKPSWGNLNIEYYSKIQELRLIVSLTSVFFINDLTMLVKYLINEVIIDKYKFNFDKSKTKNLNLLSKHSLCCDDTENWPAGALDKLNDYERSFNYKRKDIINLNINGNWYVKSTVFESMITNLFISMTILRITFNHKNSRLCSSFYASDVTNFNKKISRPNCNLMSMQETQKLIKFFSNSNNFKNILNHSTFPFYVDYFCLTLKRANFVVAEHILLHQRNSDTRQILNCSLRETSIIFNRVIENFKLIFPLISDVMNKGILNKLNIVLGELEGDLPMQAQSIHEMVLRHGPQLNEQLHKIVGQPQQANLNLVKEISLTNLTVSSAENQNNKTLFLEQSTSSTDIVSTNIEKESSLITNEIDDSNETDTISKSSLEIEFEICLKGIELNARLLSSLKAKYKLQKAILTGKSGSCFNFFAEISDHQFYFHVTASSNTNEQNKIETPVNNNIPVDTFTLQLPKISANGSYIANSSTDSAKQEYWNCAKLVYRSDGFYNIIILIGTMVHTFSTDLLNQILFAEQSFRSELSFLLERLSSERPKTPTGMSFLNVKPILFDLKIKGEGVPWLQITATTPTSIAVRFTIDNLNAFFTNRLTKNLSTSNSADFSATNNQNTIKENSNYFDDDLFLFGNAKVQLNVKLGQLYKSALYEETQDELEEYANFMTQISIQNEDSITKDSHHSFLILLNRPFLLIKSNAIDKTILLWLNYRNTYNYWKKEREKLLTIKNSRFQKEITKNNLNNKLSTSANELKSKTLKQRERSPSCTTTGNFGTDININLSLSIQNGLYICMPLYSSEPSDSSAVLMLSLQKSDVSVTVKKELVCNANFNAFKVTFVDNFDEASLSEPWLYENSSDDSTHSNYFFFPHGSYNFCTSAISPNAENKNAKCFLTIKSHMEGMLIDFDYKIGKLASLLIHTLSSSFTFDSESLEDYAPSDSSDAYTSFNNKKTSSIEDFDSQKNSLNNSLNVTTSVNNQNSVSVDTALFDELKDDNDDLSKVVGYENRVRWIERKMHEQSVLVTDLMNLGASEFAIEKERRKLRILEFERFRIFRQTMWDKIKQKVDRKFSSNEFFTSESRNTKDGQKLKNLSSTENAYKLNANSKKLKTHKRQLSRIKQQRPISKSNSNGNDTFVEDFGIIQDSSIKNQQLSESVDLNVEIQINIERGQCILRANQPSFSTTNQRILSKKLSAKDLKSKVLNTLSVSQVMTKLSIPSLNANMFYTSNKLIATLPECISKIFPGEQNRKTLENTKKKCFYMTLELASMPLETLITPSLADFFEQVVEPLPESLFDTSNKSSSEQSSHDNSVPIVVLDTSSLPLDILFYMSVQSSAIRFEGQQQRSSAADCLLTLPGLTLTASTRKFNEQDNSLAGIYLSAILSSFSLNIYSPHQQSNAHDAFSLTLDHFSIEASRLKNSLNSEDKNRIELEILSNVGSANFNYDMRRLSELLTFPRPWYRKQLVRRLFFGEHSVPTAHLNDNKIYKEMQNFDSSSLSEKYNSLKFKCGRQHSKIDYNFQGILSKNCDSSKSLNSTDLTNQKNWAASVTFLMQWKELNIKAQMSNTMGNTIWLAQQGILKGHLHLNSKKQRDVSVTFKLHSSELNAQGGAISGDNTITNLSISAHHVKQQNKAPVNCANLEFEKIESRIEWMSRTIFIGRFTAPKILINDEWKYKHDENLQEVAEAMCLIHIIGSWNDLQMIITKNTVGDMTKIGRKLISFFKDQLKNSKIVWDQEFFESANVATNFDQNSFIFNNSIDNENKYNYNSTNCKLRNAENFSSVSSFNSNDSTEKNWQSQKCYWQKILDALSDVQLRQSFFPLPTAINGITFVGGNIELKAEKISLSCMNGEMNASSWALFYMSEVGIVFNCQSNYTFLNDNNLNELGVELNQTFTFELGENFHDSEENETKNLFFSSTSRTAVNAIVCRVQHSRGFLMRHNASIEILLDAIIGDVLTQLESSQMSSNLTRLKTPPRLAHNVLRLFTFPPLVAVLKTKQSKELFSSTKKRQNNDTLVNKTEVVKSTFICDFYDAVCVQTDFNAQVGFLPELLKSYMTAQPEMTNEISSKKPANYIPSSSSATALNTQINEHENSKYNLFNPQISTDDTKDYRQYVCSEWAVDPKIMFIDRFKWNPPVIDEILKKLQIFDHRRTIPKVMQRGVLDRCDMIIAALLKQLINQVKRED